MEKWQGHILRIILCMFRKKKKRNYYNYEITTWWSLNDAFWTASLTFPCLLSLQHRGLEQLRSSIQSHTDGAGFDLVLLTQLPFLSQQDYMYQLLYITFSFLFNSVVYIFLKPINKEMGQKTKCHCQDEWGLHLHHSTDTWTKEPIIAVKFTTPQILAPGVQGRQARARTAVSQRRMRKLSDRGKKQNLLEQKWCKYTKPDSISSKKLFWSNCHWILGLKNEYKSQICIPPRKQYFPGNTGIFETILHQSVSVIRQLVDQHVAVSLK